jgi:hypothetical protein
LNHAVVGGGASWGMTTDVAVADVLDAAESTLLAVSNA